MYMHADLAKKMQHREAQWMQYIPLYSKWIYIDINKKYRFVPNCKWKHCRTVERCVANLILVLFLAHVFPLFSNVLLHGAVPRLVISLTLLYVAPPGSLCIFPSSVEFSLLSYEYHFRFSPHWRISLVSNALLQPRTSPKFTGTIFKTMQHKMLSAATLYSQRNW